MWLKVKECLLNQDNIINISPEEPHSGNIRIFAHLVSGERILLGMFETSTQVTAFVNSVREHIDKGVNIIDIGPLVNLAKLSK